MASKQQQPGIRPVDIETNLLYLVFFDLDASKNKDMHVLGKADKTVSSTEPAIDYLIFPCIGTNQEKKGKGEDC